MNMQLSIEEFAARASEAADLLRAIGNEQRLLILCHLVTHDEMSVGALAGTLGLSQSALSQHLAKLRAEEIVSFRREAQTIFYRVHDERAQRLLMVLRDIFCPELEENDQ